ncbi:MAG: response regulator [Rhodobacteraceae bacterium]|nr:response regulator [Paracoccaceae bacterium]
MDELVAFHSRKPTTARPLLGVTVLVVEDSLYACDALRLMCLHSGARLRRADCIDSARRHLKVYRPGVIIVDLGLPDGSGADLIADLADAKPRIGAILGTSGDAFAEDVALAAGADGFLSKPLDSLGVFQHTMVSCLPPDLQVSGLYVASVGSVRPDPMAYRDDLEHAAALLSEKHDSGTLSYILQFLSGLAKSADDNPLLKAVETVGALPERQRLSHPAVAKISAIVQDRMSDMAPV